MAGDAIDSISFEPQASSWAPAQMSGPSQAPEGPSSPAVPEAPVSSPSDSVALSSPEEDAGSAPDGLLNGLAGNFGAQPPMEGQGDEGADKPIYVAAAADDNGGAGSGSGGGTPATGTQGAGTPGQSQTVDRVRTGAGLLPGNPGPGAAGYMPGGSALNTATPGGISQIHQQVLPQALNPINDALSGRGTPGNPTHLGSSTMPRGMFSRTPNVSFRIDGRNVSVPMPSVSGGQTVTYHSVPVSGGGVQIEARSGQNRWNLQNSTNSILPFLGEGWNWAAAPPRR